MAIYTYITETTMKGTADDPAKKFVADNFKEHKSVTIFYGDGKAVVSIEVDDKQVVATPKNDGVIYLSDEELKTSLSSKTSLTTASKLTSVGFNAESFVSSRDERIAKRDAEISKEVTK
jgi:hypothetical protein